MVGIACGYPGYVTKGVRREDLYNYSNPFTYKCNVGYRLSTYRTCQANGAWSSKAFVCNGR